MNTTGKTHLTALVLVSALACAGRLIGQDAATEDEAAKAAALAKATLNPIASLISLPLQNNFDWGGGPADDGFQYKLTVQPVIPISLSDDWNVISRTILPYVYQENIIGASSQSGLADTVQSLFFSPVKPAKGGWIWGAGPVLQVPTATDDLLGEEKWGAGPTAVVLKQEGKLTYGALVNHIWSFAGESGRADVNRTFLQPFVSYTTKTFTSFGLNTETSYDWEREQWTVPINLFVQQLLKVGQQPISMQLGGRYYAEGPSGAPEWGLRPMARQFAWRRGSPRTDHQNKRQPTMKSRTILTALSLTLGAVTTQAADGLDRTVLPIQFPKQQAIKELYAKDVKAIPPRQEVKAPQGAPNVLVILIDDLGFGATETFGGPLKTPTLERLAQGGLRYNSFHTTALCSPTRVALKSGRNHHTGNMGFITEMATGLPGATGEVPNRVAPLAEILRHNGYSTAAFGKWHETAVWETSVSGPFDRWPTRQGFDKFYGFIGGEANQWAPYLHDGVAQVEIPNDPNYILNTDMANQAVAWLKFQKAMTPDKPLFIYYAPGAVHAPHHVSQEWIAKWKGKFDAGWDQLRAETLARQIKMGVVPPGTKLAPKPEAIKDWDTLTPDEKRLFARQAEVFAAFLEHTDHEIGRVVDAIDEIGQLDNTLIFYIAGDNGTSSEGGMSGMFNEMTYFNGVTEKVEDMVKLVDKWGGPETYPHMAAGWAVAFDSPFQWTKQVASDFGGTRVGMVAHWPKGIKANNELRPQFSHVIDIAPTVLEAAGLPEPKIVNGTPQIPMEGKSLVYTFDNAQAKERRTTQYFEIAGNRAIYHEGWFARTIHRAPWEPKPRRALDDDSAWALYDTRADFSLANDLAAANPKKLKELQAVFLKEAAKYNVLPLDDRVFERLDGALVGRPDLMGDRQSITVAEGMSGMMESAFINVKNRSKTITAEIEVPENGAHGMILAQAGRFGGWALYAKDGIPAYDYNFLGLQRTTIADTKPLAPGKHTVRFEFAYDGGGPGKGGKGTLFVNDAKVAEGRIEHTQGGLFSADETADVGIDLGTPVVEAIGAEAQSRFTGRIPKVTVEVK